MAYPCYALARAGDKRIINGVEWTCTDPEINRWIGGKSVAIKQEVCEACNGFGYWDPNPLDKCLNCVGKGSVPVEETLNLSQTSLHSEDFPYAVV